MHWDIALGPFFALVIGVISLFYDKEHSKRKWPFYVLLALLATACGLEIRSKTNDKQEAEGQKEWSQSRITELSQALGNFKEESHKYFDLIVSRLPEKLQEATQQAAREPIAPIKVQREETGYAYYGIQNFDGSWSARYFRKAYGDATGRPNQGDIVVATSNVNARAGYIEYSEEQGWLNKPVTGAIRPGDRLEVLDVNPILGSYMWIKFKRVE